MKHKLLTLAAAMTAAVLSGCCGGGCKDGKNYKIRDGVIMFNEPKPSAGQQDMLQFAADPIDTVRVGFIGLGMRGSSAVSMIPFALVYVGSGLLPGGRPREEVAGDTGECRKA